MPPPPQHHGDLVEALQKWRSCHVTVVGDFMLDRYTYGNADRLSPDAPVPVLCVKAEEARPGGASNVAICVRALGCGVSCIGVIGDDAAGTELVDSLDSTRCDVQGFVTIAGRRTTVKHNIIGLAQHRHPQKMFRIDYEQEDGLGADAETALLRHVRTALRETNILCLEDYNKGVLTQRVCSAIIGLANSKGVPVIVDPALIRDYRKYAGATAITPNRTEAALATDRLDSNIHDNGILKAIGRQILRKLQLQAIVMTLDKEGALLLERHRKAVWLSTRARQVYDVTGAGDVFAAALSCAIGNHINWVSAVRLANCAAGLKVERFGVTPIQLREIAMELGGQGNERGAKLRTLNELLVELSAHRQANKKIVFTNGCFDILHAGHVSLLKAAKRQGDILVVGLNSDSSIKRIKGPGRPINVGARRVATLSELQSVDYVVAFEHDTPSRVIRAIRPDVIVKGADYEENQVVGAAFVKSYGGRVVLIPLMAGLSTSSIIRDIGLNNPT